jgi:hypothetical protein
MSETTPRDILVQYDIMRQKALKDFADARKAYLEAKEAHANARREHHFARASSASYEQLAPLEQAMIKAEDNRDSAFDAQESARNYLNEIRYVTTSFNR